MSRRAGFTLVEVMVCVGIIAMLTSTILSLFVTSLWSWDRGSSKGEGDTTVSLALQKVTRAIDEGMSASVSSGQLKVQLPLVNNQGDYDRTQIGKGNTVKIYLSGTTLYEQIISPAGTVLSTTTLSTHVTAATFTVGLNPTPPPIVPAGAVAVSLTAQGRTGKYVMTTQMSQVVALRNYTAP